MTSVCRRWARHGVNTLARPTRISNGSLKPRCRRLSYGSTALTRRSAYAGRRCRPPLRIGRTHAGALALVRPVTAPTEAMTSYATLSIGVPSGISPGGRSPSSVRSFARLRSRPWSSYHAQTAALYTISGCGCRTAAGCPDCWRAYSGLSFFGTCGASSRTSEGWARRKSCWRSTSRLRTTPVVQADAAVVRTECRAPSAGLVFGGKVTGTPAKRRITHEAVE